MVKPLRLGRGSLALAFVGSTCALAAHASAAPMPALFKLTVTGTAHQKWNYSAAPVTDGACTRKESSEGVRSVTFRTKNAVTVRIASGKVLPVKVGGIRGTITLGGANTTDEHCGDGGTSKTTDCALTRRTFTGADLKAERVQRGTLTVTPIWNIRLTRANCPLEPLDVVNRPLGPPPKPLRLPKEAMHERKLARLTVHASRKQRTRFGSPEAGSLEEDVAWTLTFVRLQG
jgi:hypothetical protein